MPLVRRAADVALGSVQVVKDLARLQEIVQVLAFHGLGWLVAEIEVPGIGLLRRTFDEAGHRQPTPERVIAVIKDLGPTFVKLGQALSTRDDLLPREYVEALGALQEDVGPITEEQVIAALAQSFARPGHLADFDPDNLFEHFEREPLATASISQVHEATTRDHERVVVKIQRPGIKEKIENDLSILAFLARQVQHQVPETQLFDGPGTVGVLRRSLAQECDFRNEARNTEQFRANFEGVPEVVVPRVYKELSTANVLTLEFIEGVGIGKARAAGHDMRLVGERYLATAFKMLLEDGWFHGDLHPGNVKVLSGDRLGLLDFGLVGRLSPEHKQDLVDIFFAIQRRDARTIARIYWELAIKPGYVDYATWEQDVDELMERTLFGKALGDLQLAEFLRELMARGSAHGVRAPTTYTVFFKALITTEGLAKQLLPEVDPMQAMKPYVQRMVTQQYSWERLQSELMYWALSFRYSGRRLPVLAGQLVSDMQEGRFRVPAVVESSPQEAQRADERTNRLAMALVTAGLFAGSSMALGAEAPKLLGLPWPATVGYLLAVLTWGGLVRAVSRSRR